jgi:hypothetical protein
MVPNHGIYQLALAIYAGLALVTLAFGYWQVIAAPDLLRRPENTRPLELLLHSPRGAILDRNGTVLARSVPGPDGIYRREYPVVEAAPVVGYFNPNLGLAGIEAAANDALQRVRWPQWPWSLRAGVVAADVRLTLDAGLQAQIFRLFGGRAGAAVVMAPDGAVLALVSSPTFDPNRLATGQPDEGTLAYLRTLQADAGAPLLNRATQGQFSRRLPLRRPWSWGWPGPTRFLIMSLTPGTHPTRFPGTPMALSVAGISICWPRGTGCGLTLPTPTPGAAT